MLFAFAEGNYIMCFSEENMLNNETLGQCCEPSNARLVMADAQPWERIQLCQSLEKSVDDLDLSVKQCKFYGTDSAF